MKESINSMCKSFYQSHSFSQGLCFEKILAATLLLSFSSGDKKKRKSRNQSYTLADSIDSKIESKLSKTGRAKVLGKAKQSAKWAQSRETHASLALRCHKASKTPHCLSEISTRSFPHKRLFKIGKPILLKRLTIIIIRQYIRFITQHYAAPQIYARVEWEAKTP